MGKSYYYRDYNMGLGILHRGELSFDPTKPEEIKMFDTEKAVKDFSESTKINEEMADADFVKNYMADLHKMIDSQVRNSLISFCHVMLYRIRTKQSSMYNRPEKILDEIYQFCFSLTSVDSTEEFNKKLINFIGEEDATREPTAGDRPGENQTDKPSD